MRSLKGTDPYQFGPRPKTVESHRRAVERVILAMRERVVEPLSLDELAELSGFNKFHLDRVFRETTGIPPSQFMSALRIAEAKKLLIETNLSVTDVCFETGYSSHGTFTRLFTRHVGIPPRVLRHLSKSNLMSRLEGLTLAKYANPISPPGELCVSGRVTSRKEFVGPVFIGLYPSQMPTGWPVGGTLLMGPGDYSVAPVPCGSYRLLAIAFPGTRSDLSYFLPSASSILVGAGDAVLDVTNCEAAPEINIQLEEPQLTSLPVLTALPCLLPTARSER